MLRSRDRPVRRRPRRGTGRFFKRWTVPAIGAITPLLLIVVNIAAFIVHHLQAFRLIIALLAFVSGLMLNSWAGIRVYQYFHKRFPDHDLTHESNQELMIVGGMAVVIALSGI